MIPVVLGALGSDLDSQRSDVSRPNPDHSDFCKICYPANDLSPMPFRKFALAVTLGGNPLHAS